MSSGPDYTQRRPDHEHETDVPPEGISEATSATADDQVELRGLRAAGQLIARTVLTRGITLVGTVALARLLTPADFGVFAVITLIVTILTVVGDLGIGAGLVQQHDEPGTAEIETVLAVQLALFGGLGMVTAVVGPALALALDLGPGSAPLAFLFAMTILAVPLRGIPIAMLSRSLRFGPLAASEVVQQAVFFAVAVGCAAAGVGVISFGFAAVAQGIVATVIAWAAWRRRPPRPRFHRTVAARLWRFGIRMQGAHVAAWAKDAVVPIFGGLAGGVSAVGYLQFAWRNGQLVSAVDDIVTRVGFPALSRLQQDPSRFSRASGTAMEAAVLVAVGIQAWLIATAPVLVPVVFSAQWEPAADAFRLVAAGAVAGTMTAVIRTALNAAGQSGTALRAAVVGLVVVVVTFPAGVIVAGVTGGGAAFLVGSVVALAVNVWLARRLVRVAWVALLRVTLIGTAAACVAAVVVAWLPDLVGLVVSGLVYVGVFGLLAMVLEGPLLRLLWSGFRPSRGVKRTAQP